MQKHEEGLSPLLEKACFPCENTSMHPKGAISGGALLTGFGQINKKDHDVSIASCVRAYINDTIEGLGRQGEGPSLLV